MSYRDFFTRVVEHSNHSALLIKLPQRFMLLVARLVESLQKNNLLNDCRMTTVNLRLLFMDNYFNGGKAQQELELKSTVVATALKSAKRWYQEMRYL